MFLIIFWNIDRPPIFLFILPEIRQIAKTVEAIFLHSFIRTVVL